MVYIEQGSLQEVGTMMKTVERINRIKAERIHTYMRLRGLMKSKTHQQAFTDVLPGLQTRG
jgi:hypothetical protein